MPRPEVFLSHAAKDRRFVERVAAALDGRGIRYFYSKKHIAGARQWHDELGAALDRCNWFVLILSPDSVKSMWVKRELVSALQSPRYENRIVPVLKRKCRASKLSWTLPSFQHIDFTRNFESGCQELLRLFAPVRRRR